MTESENEKIIGKIVELIDLRKLDEMLEYFTDDVTVQTVGGEKRDKKGLRELFEGSFSIWSDGVYRVDRMISKGDTVVAEVHWTGVHTGEDVAGIPATGKRVEMVAVWIVDFKDGKVKVFKIFYNPDMAVQQLQE
ncbi:MAG: ester cyclase [Candidatus Bathyarchaeota archaeon]|nr:ester cyclase [Candidatus Bathyarchaeota archaeon]